MANEVIIEEYATVGTQQSANVQIPNKLVTSQTLTIGSQSAAFNPRTAYLRVQSKGTGFWYAIGATGVTATANTAGSCWLPADQFRAIALGSGDVKVATTA